MTAGEFPLVIQLNAVDRKSEVTPDARKGEPL